MWVFGAWYIVPVCHDPHNLPGNHPTLSGQANEVVDGTLAVEDDRPDWLEFAESWLNGALYRMGLM